MSELVVEELKPAIDLDSIIMIEEASFLKPFTRADLILDRNALFLGIKKQSRLVAYAYLHDAFDELELYRIAVLEEFKRQGLAMKIIKTIKDILRSSDRFKRVILEVKKNNIAAIGLYHKAGFKDFSYRENYYSDGEAAYLMEYLKESEL